MVILYFASIVLGALGAWLISLWGRKIGLTDRPNERSSHHTPTSKGGGIGILLVFVLSSVVADIPFSFWLPISLLGALGFCSDKTDLQPGLRLFIQFGLIAWLVLKMGSFSPGHIWNLLSIGFWIIFIVGTANFYNFMDGINGIAGIAGVVGFGLMGLFIMASGVQVPYFVLTLCLALSCVGFLPFNVPNARVFLGDVGSLLLGGTFAGLVFVISRDSSDFMCMLSYLFPVYADELTTMYVRLKDGDNLIHAHRRHLYQLLANEGRIPHWKVSCGYGMLQLFVGTVAFLARPLGGLAVLLLLVSFFSIFTVGSFLIRLRLENHAHLIQKM